MWGLTSGYVLTKCMDQCGVSTYGYVWINVLTLTVRDWSLPPMMMNPQGSDPALSMVICMISFGILARVVVESFVQTSFQLLFNSNRIYFHFKLFLTWESWSSPTCALFLRLKITILSIFPSTILPQDNLIVRTGRGCGVERAGGRVGRCPNQLFLTYFCAILSSCVLVNCCLTTLSSSSSSSSSMLNSKFCKVIWH